MHPDDEVKREQLEYIFEQTLQEPPEQVQLQPARRAATLLYIVYAVVPP
jgi:hypothetical protein